MDNATLVKLGLRIRSLREAAGFSQENLAEAAGLSRSFYGKVERGKENLSILTLEKIASALDQPMLAFFAESPRDE